MKTAVAVISLCLVLAVNAFKINVGVKKVPVGKYPFQVSIWYNKYNYNTLHCTGSILNQRWILTTASCIDRRYFDINEMTVRVGSNKFGEPFELYKAEYMTEHENYDGIKNDIGLIRVDRDIEFNDKVQPVKLPSEDFVKADYPVTMTGYGKIELTFDSTRSHDPLEVELKLITPKQCEEIIKSSNSNSIFKSEVDKDRICTVPKIQGSTCDDYNGGALVADGIQIGIVSFGDVCFGNYSQSYYKVYNYLDWINQRINDLFINFY